MGATHGKAPRKERSGSTAILPEYAELEADNVRPASSILSDSSRRDSLASLDQVFDGLIPAEDNGRVTLTVGKDAAKLYSQLVQDFEYQESHDDPQPDVLQYAAETSPRSLNIAMQVVGSRGDVQPFLALGKGLQEFGHRVRLATHPVFRDLVESYGIEFFSIGGDPAELMAYMVKNPGLVPKFAAVRKGEVYRRRRAIRDMLRGCWRSCFEPTDGYSPRSVPSRIFSKKTTKSSDRATEPRPFVADMIIANPPSFAHIHCAEKLGIPVHIVFTMPWSPTREFAHPLADVKSSETDVALVHYLSYFLVDAIIWQGLGSVINRFRFKVLGLQTIHPTLAPGMVHRLRIPHSYCWSAHLFPKPRDWGPHITVPGYFNLPRHSDYSPPRALENFLASGPPPIFVGFGSIVVDDPNKLTMTILKAIELSGVRAIISSGWGSLNVEEPAASNSDDNIYFLRNDCPHDYLFQHVSLVIHHGGAGTTAAGIAAGRPTIVVPFFGDQFFWGYMVHRSGVGPAPIHNHNLTLENLALAISAAQEPAMQRRALAFSKKIQSENGIDVGISAIHAQLPRATFTPCALFPDRVASLQSTIKIKNSSDPRSKQKQTQDIYLSPLAATFLRKHQLISSSTFDNMEMHRPAEHNIASGPFDPVSGAAWAVLDLLYDAFKGMGEMLTEVGHIPYLGFKAVDRGIESIRSPPPPTPSAGSASVTSASSFTTSTSHLPGGYFVKGTLRVCKASARAPGAFASAIASGAHNLPLLYNDPTVRPTPRITGMSSGLKASAAELGFGLYDGLVGVVTQPIMGAIHPHATLESKRMRENTGDSSKGKGVAVEQEIPPWTVGAGALGFAKGLGRGIVGMPIKFFAAAGGIVGYPLKGIDAEITKAWKGDDMKEVRKQRNLQGEKEYFEAAFTSEQIRDVTIRWNAIVDGSVIG